MPFLEFFLENVTLTRGTLTCALHMEAHIVSVYISASQPFPKCARVCGGGGSLPHETGRKASQCILHADPKKRGFKLINSFVFCSS